MTTFSRRLTVWLVLACSALAFTAQGAAKKPAADKPKHALKGEYMIMASELKLADEQIAKLETAVKARDEALAAWQKENGDKLKAASDALAKAKEAKDDAAVKKAQADIKAIQEGRRKAEEDNAIDPSKILTPEQAAQWEGFKVYRQLAGRYAKAELTDDQKVKLKALCAEQGKDLAAIKAGDAKARSAVIQKVTKAVEDSLLTAEQKAKMVPAKKDEPKKPENK